MKNKTNFSLLVKNAEDVRNVTAGEVVFTAGDPGDTMYVVKSGEVEVCVDDQVIDVVTAGGMFGEMALLDSGPRSATAIARSDGELVPINPKRFTFLVQQMPYFALDVMRSLVARLRGTNENL